MSVLNNRGLVREPMISVTVTVTSGMIKRYMIQMVVIGWLDPERRRVRSGTKENEMFCECINIFVQMSKSTTAQLIGQAESCMYVRIHHSVGQYRSSH